MSHRVGLAFFANGLGCASSGLVSGRIQRNAFKRESAVWRHEEGLPASAPLPCPLPATFPVEEARLGGAPLYSIIQIFGLLVFGWSLTPVHSSGGSRVAGADDVVTQAGKAGVSHWIVPLMAQFAVGWSNTSVLNSNQVLLTDLYPGRSASASAVVNLTRNLLAAVGIAVAGHVTAAVSPGWFGMLLAGLVALGLMPFWLHRRLGPVWREERQSRVTNGPAN